METTAIIAIGLIGLFLVIMTILMPIFVWQIYKQGIATKRYLDGFNDGFNRVLLELHHIKQNTIPESRDDLSEPL